MKFTEIHGKAKAPLPLWVLCLCAVWAQQHHPLLLSPQSTRSLNHTVCVYVLVSRNINIYLKHTLHYISK